ncbi:restriction endonuclease subunit S [Escherichia coli]|uniref:restriction endonuclease subunit S n=1 Tax=Escherichia coli TaxID=562 RepID=UPI000BE2D562|nr:restriction endonuclease subunit S [Escherichia coli]HCS4515285.1 restriction endonuclease subunit S [Escherichia coli]HCS5056874.1 restriction endonuclease subunit S [Escherichia coli]HCS5099659.1 restriction endonuclease subunit S [Escherichia coli]HCS5181438.1 restriction endonuclease subunit S [Escherichia coli]
MSELSYLEKLLDGVEVEWVTLGSMADIGTGSSNRQDESENGIYPFYVRSKNILKSDTFEFDEVAIVIPGEGGIGDIFHYVEGKYALHQRAYRIRITTNAVDTKFLYYFMSSSFKQYILTKSVGATAISIRKPMLEGFKVPIPSPDNPEKSLAIQSEIVRILDKFTALTAELTAELNMRKKQYNYYRDQLLSFKEGEVEWKTLGTFADNFDSLRKPITSGLRETGNIPYYGASGIVDYVKDYIFDDDLLLISEDGANLIARNTPIAFSISGKTWVNNHAHVLKFKNYTEQKFVEYYLNNINLTPYISGAAQPKLNKKNLESIRIPNPSLKEKERIVTILDKFDTLTNSITEGLPREIELRQKQYEYYRDLLFSFPKPETVSN